MIALFAIKLSHIADIAQIIQKYYSKINPCAFLFHLDDNAKIPLSIKYDTVGLYHDSFVSTRIALTQQHIIVHLFDTFYISTPGTSGFPGTTNMIHPMYILEKTTDNNNQSTLRWKLVTAADSAAVMQEIAKNNMTCIYSAPGAYFEDNIAYVGQLIKEFKI
jgi:hypothetical protein